jgi:transcriptional regulator with XRE-family HTH domain
MRRRIATVESPPVPADRARVGTFDADAFFDALEGVRIARKETWKQVAKEAGVSASTLTRMAQGKRPDVDSLAAISRWSGLVVDDYVRGHSPMPVQEPLAMISTYLRGDKNLSPEAVRALDAVIKATYQRLLGE